MSGINKAQILGRLGADPELRYMTNGDAVCNLSVATSEEWKDKETGEKKQSTEWHKIVLYRRAAEIAGEYLKKGDQACFFGRLKTRKWNKDGVDHYTTEIIADELHLLGARSGEQKPEPQPSFAQQEKAFDDDIPF